ncbi:MAG TPA: hypothetical protein VNN08_10190, partial [Thermoanaerobaculia bacterium]|nr:hypothetical protein [Thermoanaerobaculia bacterium]
MILLPIGRDDGVIRRHAWISYIIIGLNIFVWLAMATNQSASGSDYYVGERWLLTMRFYAAHPYLHLPPSIENLVSGSLRARIAATATPPAASVDVAGE